MIECWYSSLSNEKMLVFFLFLPTNIYCGYSLDAPHRGASNEYSQYMFTGRNKKHDHLVNYLTQNYAN